MLIEFIRADRSLGAVHDAVALRAAIRAGELGPESLARRFDQAAWRPAREIEDCARLFPVAENPTPPRQPASPARDVRPRLQRALLIAKAGGALLLSAAIMAGVHVWFFGFMILPLYTDAQAGPIIWPISIASTIGAIGYGMWCFGREIRAGLFRKRADWTLRAIGSRLGYLLVVTVGGAFCIVVGSALLTAVIGTMIWGDSLRAECGAIPLRYC